MQTKTELLLTRLEDLKRVVENDPDGLALLGLGSAGLDRNRLDDWSDLDFFVIVKPGAKQRFLDQPQWLDLAHPVSYLFRNTVDGFKLLFADGVFGEMAVFEPEELQKIPFAQGAVLWSRPGFDISLLEPKSMQGRLPETVDVDHAVGELLTCLYVGLCRFHRGETLSAWRFVQVYCLDRVMELSSVWLPCADGQSDIFNRDRRAEQRHPELSALLETILTGYRDTPRSALAILEWVSSFTTINPAIRDEILGLAESVITA